MTGCREMGGKRAEVAVRPIAKQETCFRMSAGETVQHLARVYADSRQVRVQAIARIQRDFQSASIAVFMGRCVWRADSFSSSPNSSSSGVSESSSATE